MKATKITYNDFYVALLTEAERRGFDKTEYARRCGLIKQTLTKYDRGQGLTAPTMYALMGGLRMKIDDVERCAGFRMSDEQREELEVYSFTRNHRDLIKHLMAHPEKVHEFEKTTKKE